MRRKVGSPRCCGASSIAIFAAVFALAAVCQQSVFAQDCSQQTSSCPSNLQCQTTKQACSIEVDGTNNCPGVCDTPLMFDVTGVSLSSDAVEACMEPCEDLALRSDDTNMLRHASCRAGCRLGPDTASSLLCMSACALHEEGLWQEDCTLACARAIALQVYLDEERPSACALYKGNCTVCAQQGCQYCQLSQNGAVVYSDCFDADNEESISDCQEVGGTLPDSAAMCPMAVDPCEDERPCPQADCEADEQLMTYPLEDGECCPETECIPTQMDASCSSYTNCTTCADADQCAWCTDGSANGVGFCAPSDEAAICQEEGGFFASSCEACPATCETDSITCPDGTRRDEVFDDESDCCPSSVNCVQLGMCSEQTTCSDCSANECNWCDLGGSSVCISSSIQGTQADCEEQGGIFVSGTDGECPAESTSATTSATEATTSATTTTSTSTTTRCLGVACTLPTCTASQRLVMTGDMDDCCPVYECHDVEVCRRGETPSGASCSCTRDNTNCFACFVSTTNGEDVGCAICRNSFYLNTDTEECVSEDDCPSSGAFVSYTNFRSICGDPFECTDGVDAQGHACDCPSGCTSCSYVAGRNNATCTACESDRYLTDGNCPRQASCQRGAILGSPTSEQCSCGITSCHRCTVSATSDPICEACRDRTYLHENQCIGACPPPLVSYGLNAFGRFCTDGPFVCHKRRVVSESSSRFGKGCVCPADCHTCTWDVDGVTCTTCKNGKLLLDGTCVSQCPLGDTHSGVSSYGRDCRSPYTCRKGVDMEDDSYACRCPDRDCFQCNFLANNVPREAPCTICRNSKFLLDGECRNACPVGTVANSVLGAYGRECIQL